MDYEEDDVKIQADAVGELGTTGNNLLENNEEQIDRSDPVQSTIATTISGDTSNTISGIPEATTIEKSESKLVKRQLDSLRTSLKKSVKVTETISDSESAVWNNEITSLMVEGEDATSTNQTPKNDKLNTRTKKKIDALRMKSNRRIQIQHEQHSISEPSPRGRKRRLNEGSVPNLNEESAPSPLDSSVNRRRGSISRGSSIRRRNSINDEQSINEINGTTAYRNGEHRIATENGATDELSSVAVPSVAIALDDFYPTRLVNPLVELGPPSVPSVTPKSTTFSKDTKDISDQIVADEVEEINEKSDTGKGGVMTPAGNVRKGKGASNNNHNNSTTNKISQIELSDWLPLLDIWYGPPDTYPISYWARLLGLSIVVQENQDEKEQSCSKSTSCIDASSVPLATWNDSMFDINRHIDFVSSSGVDNEGEEDVGDDYACSGNDLNNRGRILLTKDEILKNAKLSIHHQSDPIYTIPSEGSFASQVWQGRQFRVGEEKDSDSDERILGHYKDPLYEELVHWTTCSVQARSKIVGRQLTWPPAKLDSAKAMSKDDTSQGTSVVTLPQGSNLKQNSLGDGSASASATLNAPVATGVALSSQRRGTGITRRRSFYNSTFDGDEGNSSITVLVIPVTTPEHTRLQPTLGQLQEIINRVNHLGSVCCTSIQWVDSDLHWGESDPWDSNNIGEKSSFVPTRDDSFVKSMLVGQSIADCKKCDDVTIRFPNEQPRFSFHTLAQARVRFPHLSDVITNVVHASASKANSTTSCGVTDGWIAIQHQSVDSQSSCDRNEEFTCRSKEYEAVKVGNRVDQNVTGKGKAVDHDVGSIGNEVLGNGYSQVTDSPCRAPANLSDQEMTGGNRIGDVSLAAYLTYQFAWFRDKSQAVEESELIARVLSLSVSSVCTDSDNTALNRSKELRITLVSFFVEFLKAASVWYAVFPIDYHDDKAMYERYFRMVSSDSSSYNCETSEQERRTNCTSICDVQKCSSRYAMLLHKEQTVVASLSSGIGGKDHPDVSIGFCMPKRRWLLYLPPYQCAKEVFSSSITEVEQALGEKVHRTCTADNSFVKGNARQVPVRIRVKMLDSDHCTDEAKDRNDTTQPRTDGVLSHMEIRRINEDGVDGSLVSLFATAIDTPPLDLMRNFQAPMEKNLSQNEDAKCEILATLHSLQLELKNDEKSIEPKLISLLSAVVDDRIRYEDDLVQSLRIEEVQLMVENQKIIDRRKQLDEAWEAQLEQDMDAVCAICNDGEVTPDNQIIFCDSCNVAVHQMCYGIEQVPDGDYFCVPCKRLGRDQWAGAQKQAAKPLPIRCELCPLKQGAFVRTDCKPKRGSEPIDKWVHSVCAKWQGLRFLDVNNPNLLEDVSETKHSFRRYGIRCDLCLGEYGAMNKCMEGEVDGFGGCNRYYHVTCARAVGTLRVIHGENCNGPVAKNPWRLVCPEHSKISPADIPERAIAIDVLIRAAQDFPPEPPPPPEPVAPKPFNHCTKRERDFLLAIPSYENPLMIELLTKRFHGVRCEICGHLEDDSKNLSRCSGCNIVICFACKIQPDLNQKGQFYHCPTCAYVAEKNKSGEEFETPKCAVCFQNGGFLRQAFATAVHKKSYWKTHPKEYSKSLFGRQLWIHAMCAFWHPKLTLPFDTGEVNLNTVALRNGRGFFGNQTPCFLCGKIGGLKVVCKHDDCRTCDGQRTTFHVTCARQAGLEVALGEGDEFDFYVNCYRHCGNTYNLRARLEDMIEVEKRRAGKDLSKCDPPMKFAVASKILNAGVQIIATLGWAWRWAEWWVSYDSSWEPLLEPGQDEKQMTKEELRIVDSTTASRCADARQCRLAAFGAALRNRAYDIGDEFDNDSLHQALRAILNTKSLVGLLPPVEIDFFVDWLGRAYRSKSRLLFLGEDCNDVSKSHPFCVHSIDGSPKFMLLDRAVPGKEEMHPGQIFESSVVELDDFMRPMGTEEVVKSPRGRPKSIKYDNLPKRKIDKRRTSKEAVAVDDNTEMQNSPLLTETAQVKENSVAATENLAPDSMGTDEPESIIGSDSNQLATSDSLMHPLSSIDIVEENVSIEQHSGKKLKSPGSISCEVREIATKTQKSGSGPTKVSNYNISNWNATDEAKKMLQDLSKTQPFIQGILKTAARQGVLIEQIDSNTGLSQAFYRSITDAHAKCGVHRDVIGPVLRGEKSSFDGKVWRYAFRSSAKPETLIGTDIDGEDVVNKNASDPSPEGEFKVSQHNFAVLDEIHASANAQASSTQVLVLSEFPNREFISDVVAKNSLSLLSPVQRCGRRLCKSNDINTVVKGVKAGNPLYKWKEYKEYRNRSKVESIAGIPGMGMTTIVTAGTRSFKNSNDGLAEDDEDSIPISQFVARGMPGTTIASKKPKQKLESKRFAMRLGLPFARKKRRLSRDAYDKKETDE